MADYLLPDVGEGLTEAEIVSWKVKVGDHVEVNDVIVEVETAKSLVELPSPFAGEVSAILVNEGDTVAVGTPIISIGAAAAGAPEPAARPEIDLSNPAGSGLAEGESLVGRMKADRGPLRRPRRGAATAASEAGAATQMQVQGAFALGGAQSQEVAPADEPPVPAATAPVPEQRSASAARALAKPPVRKLAKDLGVDLHTLTPSGPDGTVTREDVQQAAPVGTSSAPAATPAATHDVPADRREPIKGVRKAMGQAMVQSAFTLPHVTIWTTVDATRTLELVDSLRRQREFRDVRATPLLVLARACTLAMRRTPEVNALWDDAAQEVVYRSRVNLGIAAATPRGLLVPNVKGADALPLVDLARAIGDLVETARSGRTQPADLAGGTFTITNVGPFGMEGGTPIINPGESAILCFGAISRRPWVVDDQVVPRDVCTLALSFDHRLIDGETGSRFLADVAGILGDPARALLF